KSAATSPKSTAIAPVRFVPVIVTDVPPLAGPLVGLSPVTVGVVSPSEYVNWSAATVVEVPFDVVTVISTTPAAASGLTATIDVSDTTLNTSGREAPNATPTAPEKLWPLIV